MFKYRKIPVEIEAYQYGQDGVTPPWYDEALRNGTIRAVQIIQPYPPLKIATIDGVMTCHHGDWIIKGVENELYPCKNSVFQATYEKVNE